MKKQKNRALAEIIGAKDYPDLRGVVTLQSTPGGVLVTAQISGLPVQNHCAHGSVFGFHIHSGTTCSGNEEDAFLNAGTHFNPENCPHPYHAGDMPPLFGVHGFAYLSFLTDRFTIEDVMGKAVIIHDSPDDFTSQPAGNSGAKIACGIITYS